MYDDDDDDDDDDTGRIVRNYVMCAASAQIYSLRSVSRCFFLILCLWQVKMN